MYYVTFMPVLVPTVIDCTKHIENVSSKLLFNQYYCKYKKQKTSFLGRLVVSFQNSVRHHALHLRLLLLQIFFFDCPLHFFFRNQYELKC